MPKSIIKVYFNNGCTTLKFNDCTSAEDIIKVVIKGRLSLNELRFKQCFRLRSTRFNLSFKDFDPSGQNDSSDSNNGLVNKIEEFFWLKNNTLIKDWLKMIGHLDDESNATDFWKLQLRIRYLPSDLNEIQFKDPVTLSYYYEQIKNDFNLYVANGINDQELVPILLDLGCLEMRRSFQNMNPNVLDKKINFEYLEKDVGLKRFFPDIVLQQKAKNLKKMIIKGLKTYENWNEADCMIKFLEKLTSIWKYAEESYQCHLGTTWSIPILVTLNYDTGISCKMNNSKETFQNAKYGDILQINTELDENQTDGLLKLKISEAKELLVFKFTNLREAENMASLIDGFCCLQKKETSLWLNESKNRSSNLSQNSENRKSSEKSFTDESTETNKRSSKTKNKNFAQILSDSGELATSESSIENSNLNDGKNENFKQYISDLSKSNQIQRESLVFHEKLGSGQFGDVFRGTYKKTASHLIDVAIKILKNKEDNVETNSSEKNMILKRFFREAKIMQNFDHPHIIKLVGVCIDDTLSIVMELAKFGQLRTYLQNNINQIETTILLLYCLQLNGAMEYLESKKFVHRDIAARNILVFNHECIKLADFGLSREIDENVYLASKCKLPIKWMAPESINFRKFTSLSDVWMFGICIWEIMSFGEKPFQGIKNPDVIKLIEEKQRLDKPEKCPNELYKLMLQCWEYDSSKRPNFSQLKNSIDFIYTQYKDKKVPISLSNASSLKSDHSLSSFSNGSTSSSLLSVTMTICRNRSPNVNFESKTDQSCTPIGKNLTPPPKPSRFNMSKIGSSPVRNEQKRYFQPFSPNETSTTTSLLTVNS
ncbi:unnamed protein product [Brachionus calyciflorus]|uniref:Non-specific protein-tyrosine kinase n=1 Tax=Brachionus calyciflorus TaxID=104777 RepID=A0A813NHQ4_9BILA|nr:unnamed protein product [Brachionus calyciflorus]